MTVVCNASLFRTVSRFVSTDPRRCYIGGVFICAHPSQGVYLVATDGAAMLIAHDPNGSVSGQPPIVKLPAHMLKACGPDRNGVEKQLIVSDDGSAVLMLLETAEMTVPGVLVDGTYPAWERIAKPEIQDFAPEQFSFSEVKRFGDAGKELGSKSFWIFGAKQNAAVIRFHGRNDVYGVLGPMRQKENAPLDLTIPAFFQGVRYD